MEKIAALILLVALAGCAGQSNDANNTDFEILPPDTVDAIKSNLIDEVVFDTANLETSPVAIVAATNYMANDGINTIKVKIKNNSAQPVKAVQVAWYLIDAFGEPLPTGQTVPGIDGGTFTGRIAPGKTVTLEWASGAASVGEIKVCWPRRVALADGSQWHAYR